MADIYHLKGKYAPSGNGAVLVDATDDEMVDDVRYVEQMIVDRVEGFPPPLVALALARLIGFTCLRLSPNPEAMLEIMLKAVRDSFDEQRSDASHG